MSDAFWIAMLASLPMTLAAVGTLIVSVRNTRKSDTIISKAAEIHSDTNGNLSKVTDRLDTALGRIEELQRVVTAMKQVDHDGAIARAKGGTP